MELLKVLLNLRWRETIVPLLNSLLICNFRTPWCKEFKLLRRHPFKLRFSVHQDLTRLIRKAAFLAHFFVQKLRDFRLLKDVPLASQVWYLRIRDHAAIQLFTLVHAAMASHGEYQRCQGLLHSRTAQILGMIWTTVFQMPPSRATAGTCSNSHCLGSLFRVSPHPAEYIDFMLKGLFDHF